MLTPKIDQLPETEVQNLYDLDFYAWTQQQAMLLRQAGWHQLDLPNLIEEIEALGRQERAELRNRLRVLIGHLLKWEYQPTRRGRSWVLTIRVQRRDTRELLLENPSLKPYLRDTLPTIYAGAKDLAESETQLPGRTFPEKFPYSLEEILSDRFYPGEPAAPDLTE